MNTTTNYANLDSEYFNDNEDYLPNRDYEEDHLPLNEYTSKISKQAAKDDDRQSKQRYLNQVKKANRGY